MSFRVDVIVGPEHYTATDESAAGYGLARSVSWSRAASLDRPWPVPSNPATVSFALVAPTAADLAWVVRGMQVRAQLRTPGVVVPGQDPTIGFDGRVSDVVVSPTVVRDPLTGIEQRAVIAEVVAVELVADFAELTIGDTPWPSETMTDRVARIFAAAGLAAPTYMPLGPPVPTVVNNPTVLARDVDSRPFADVLEEHLAVWVQDYLTVYALTSIGFANARFRPVPLFDTPDPVLPVLTGWQMQPFHGTGVMTRNMLPGTFVDKPDGSGWGIVMDTENRYVIDAGVVPRAGARWAQQKTSAQPNTVEVPYDAGGTPAYASASNGETPPVVYRVANDPVLTGAGAPAAAQLAAQLYLPEPPNADDLWAMDDFTWNVAPDDPAFRGAWLLGGIRLVAPIPASWNPSNREWFLGQLSAITVTVAAGEVTAQAQLRTLAREVTMTGPSVGQLTIDGAGAVTLDQLNARDTINDYTFVRNP